MTGVGSRDPGPRRRDPRGRRRCRRRAASRPAVAASGARREPRAGTDVLAPPPEATDGPRGPEDGTGRGTRRGPVEPIAPTLERPEGTPAGWSGSAQRLSRSQGALGRGLLALLSRDRHRRGHLGGDRGHPHHRRHRRRRRPRSSSSGCAPGCGSRASAAAPVRDVLREELLALVDPEPRPPPGGAAARRPPGRRPRGRGQRHRQDHDRRQARPRPRRRGQARRARRGRHVPRRRRRAAHHLGRARRRRAPCAAPRAPTRPASPSRRSATRRRAGGRRRPRRHRRPAAEQGRPHGRARQGQARRGEAGPGDRGAARPRRDHRPERHDPGPRLLRGRRRHAASCSPSSTAPPRAASWSPCSASSASRSSSSASARAPTTWRRSTPSAFVDALLGEPTGAPQRGRRGVNAARNTAEPIVTCAQQCADLTRNLSTARLWATREEPVAGHRVVPCLPGPDLSHPGRPHRPT